MTYATKTIQFRDLTFIDDNLKLRDVEGRLKSFLKDLRRQAQEPDHESGRINDDDLVQPYNLVTDEDMRRIKGRAMRLLERVHSSTGMYHLSEEQRARLTPLRGGLPVAHIGTEREADEIAAALRAEMTSLARGSNPLSTQHPCLGMPSSF